MKTITITNTYSVSDCRNCPYHILHHGQGECWHECQHPEYSGPPYGNMLWGCFKSFEAVPDWCPLGLGGTTA